MVVEVIRLIDTNKAKLAFLAPFIVTVLGVLGTWIVTGEFNVQEIRTATAGVLTSIAAFVAVYFAKAGMAQVQLIPDTEVNDEGKVIE